MKVNLTYFKPSGKYYSDGEYFTGEKDLWMIWNEVEEMLVSGRLPGLVEGSKEFFVLIDVPDHPYRHLHLLVQDFEEHPLCEVDRCPNPAVYEGWHRVLDFSGNPSGAIQRRLVCESHKTLLIGNRVE